MCTVRVTNRKYILANKDWMEKTYADVDAVFLTYRLRTKRIVQVVTSNGIHLANCRHVNYVFFGNFEVISC